MITQPQTTGHWSGDTQSKVATYCIARVGAAGIERQEGGTEHTVHLCNVLATTYPRKTAVFCTQYMASIALDI